MLSLTQRRGVGTGQGALGSRTGRCDECQGPSAAGGGAGDPQVLGHVWQRSLSGEVLRGTENLAGAYQLFIKV